MIRPVKPSFEVAHAVVGGGVVGLACAARLARHGPTVLLEKNRRLGEEISSRNSEVIHAGLYYPPDSLKARFCISGRKQLYDYCSKNEIPHRKIGKWIVASRSDETGVLDTLKTRADRLEVPLRWVSEQEIRRGEPALNAVLALESPETGIIDSHALMNHLHWEIEQLGSVVSLDSPVEAIQKVEGKYEITFGGAEGATFTADAVINAAGLHSDKVARLAMGDRSPYSLHFLKGYYFSYSGKSIVSRLVYPIPDHKHQTLGVHATLDMQGRLRFGPDAHWINSLDYSLSDSSDLKDQFYKAITRYLPDLHKQKLHVDYTGIRPKLAGPGDEKFRDFVIQEESAAGYPGLVNLVGIESPGLTSSLAIADHVASLLGHCTPSLDDT